ncbi:MAG TPA: DUF362 domain-containing protein [Bryobacteraceae bacterium]|jgi:uncharacterized protein (DUF362 family)
MRLINSTRRDFLTAVAGGALASSALAAPSARPVVSVVKIRNGNVDAAVEGAIELLGGMRSLTEGKERILLKPNLVSAEPKATTKLPVVRTLARLMKGAGKDVSIGEGSAAAAPFNVHGSEVFRTTKKDLLNGLQQYVFDQLGYSELAKSLGLPLVNLHTGELVEVKVPGAFVFDSITIHRALAETDLLCSVPMMKTHVLAGVTLGMKNLIGVYPGSVYQAVRGRMHDATAKVEPSGTAAAIVDMVRANKLGLVVVDGSTAMEGNGPWDGPLVPMEVIVAGTNPLATDMVAANLMGFDPPEIPTFTWANKAGLRPERLEEIEVRGEPVEKVRRRFKRPLIQPWNTVRNFWATREI